LEPKAYKEGATYIIRSNEEEPIVTGIFLGNHPEFNIPVLLVNDVEMMVFSPIAEYSDALWEELSGMTRNEQWVKVCELDRLVPYLTTQKTLR
jgi:hypothetical protein